jgi:hypothetical protein
MFAPAGLRMIALCLGLAGCVTQTLPDGGAEVDSSFLLFEQSAAAGEPPARLAAYLKAQPRDGMLGVCGVVLAEGPDNRVQNIWRMLADPASHITWGTPAVVPALEQWPKVPTAFLPGHQTLLVARDLAAVRKPRAACVKTDRPWRPDYASEPMRLHLAYTVPSAAPIYIYTPPPRRK